MPKELNLAEHVVTPEGGVPPKLQYVAQDLYDLQGIEEELTELNEKINDSASEAAFNLNLALDITGICRGALSRALCLLTYWAPKVGESTTVTIDDTKKKFVEALDVEAEDPAGEVTTIPPKGTN